MSLFGKKSFLRALVLFVAVSATARVYADDCCYLDFDEKECKELGGCYANDGINNPLSKERAVMLKGTYTQSKLVKGSCDHLKAPENKVKALVVEKSNDVSIWLKQAEVSVSVVKRACDLKRLKIEVDETGKYVGIATDKTPHEKTTDRIKLKNFANNAGPLDFIEKE